MQELRTWLQEVRNAAAIVQAASELLESDSVSADVRAFAEAAHERGLERLSDVLLDEAPAGVDLANLDLLQWPQPERAATPIAE